MDSLGNPVRLKITAGQEADITHAAELIEGLACQAVIADKAYDSNAFVEQIESQEALVVIPSKSNRKQPRTHDAVLYKERNLVERFFNLAKHCRRVATRYEKTARNFLAFWTFVSITLLLR